MATLTLDAVTKRFGADTVLDGVSLATLDNETVAVFGPSGSGKTVLLRVIAGIHAPDGGQIAIDGQRVDELAPEHRDVGMAFQNFALFPHMSALDNIASPLKARRGDSATVKERVTAIARLLKIEHVLDHMPRELSNGQKQRTALARALVAAPKVLLLDDPLRNVDAKLRFEMRLELPRLLAQFGSTVLFVTQDYKEAMALGHRIAVLIDGRIVQFDTAEAIYARPISIAVARLFGDPPINLIEITPERAGDAWYATVAGGRVPLRPDAFRNVQGDGHNGRAARCVLGIRPEAVQFCAADAPGALAVTVEAVTPVNERVVRLVVAEDGTEILASSPAQADMPHETRAHVRLPADAHLCFDPANGRRLQAQGPA
jgi:multiple sugar transport system ATP-binding protein